MGNQAQRATEGSSAEKSQHRTVVMQSGKTRQVCVTRSEGQPTPSP